MKAKRTFNPQATLAEVRAGRLRGDKLRRAIKTAEEFGQKAVAAELRLSLVDPESFAGDAAPPELKKRVAEGIAALRAMGRTLSRTMPMLARHGVIETLDRIGRYPEASKNFELLRDAGRLDLTAEVQILDYPHLFSAKAIAVARKRLGRLTR